MASRHSTPDLQWLTRVSVLAALAAVLMFNVQFPLLPSAPFLKFDPSDVPALVAGFALGPAAGMAVAALKDLLYLLAHLSVWELVGVPMSLLASASMVWPAATLYWMRKTKGRAISSLILAGWVSVCVMTLANWFLLPPFFHWMGLGVPADMTRYLVTAVIPFNTLKCALNGLVTFLVYKRVSPLLKPKGLARS